MDNNKSTIPSIMHIKEEPNGQMHFLHNGDYRQQKFAPDPHGYHGEEYMSRSGGAFSLFHPQGKIVSPLTFLVFGRMHEGPAYRRESEELLPETGNMALGPEGGLHPPVGYMGGHTTSGMAPNMPLDFFCGNYPQFGAHQSPVLNSYYPMMNLPYPGQFPFPSTMPQEEPAMHNMDPLRSEPKQPAHPPNFIADHKISIDVPKRKNIGRLSYEERQRRIERYRAKRNTRVWVKKISYSCRKRVADQRPRVKGRFISKNEPAGGSEVPAASVKNFECGSIESAGTPLIPQQVQAKSQPIIKEENNKKVAREVFHITRNSKEAPAAASN